MSAPSPLHRTVLLAGLLALAAPALTHAQTRDAGTRDAGSRDAGTRDAGRSTSSGDGVQEGEDGVYYPDGDESDDPESGDSAIKAGGGGVSCALGEGAGASGAMLLLGVLAMRRAARRPRRA